jgi:peroxin-10
VSCIDVVRRANRGIQKITTIPENPNIRPPSYALLGILILVRLSLRLAAVVRSFRASPAGGDGKTAQYTAMSRVTYIDTTSVANILHKASMADDVVKDPERDEYTQLSVASLSSEVRDRRKCALCLEERTASTLTECGHLFCWDCIVPWTREKVRLLFCYFL